MIGVDSTARNNALRAQKFDGHYGYNLKSALLNYKIALSNAANAMVRVHCIGDSITRGEYSSVEFTKSWAAQLRALLQTQYGNAPGEGWIGAYEFTLPSGAQPRWAYPSGTSSGWTWSANWGMNAGNLQPSSSTSTAPVQVTFTGTAVRLLYIQATNGGQANITIDGAAPATNPTITCYNAVNATMASTTWTGLSAGSHTLTITPQGNGILFIEGILTNDNAANGIQVNRIGYSGSQAVNWNNSITLARFQSVMPHLAIIAFGMNEANGANKVPIATYKSNMGSIISTFRNAGASVLLVPYQQPDVSGWISSNPNPWSAYVQAMYELADQYNCGIVDIYQAWGAAANSGEAAYTFAQGLGLFGVTNNDWSGGSGSNLAHPSDKGYNYIAQTIYRNLIL